ncbi:hypothetical protein Hanom_Chr04g00319521 [Helianthus anomalus]
MVGFLTKDGLRLTHILLDSYLHPFYEEVEETVDHLFTGCRFALEVWSAVASWCHLQALFAFSCRDLLSLHSFLSLPKTKKRSIQSIIFACWVLWKNRNASFLTILGGIRLKLWERLRLLDSSGCQTELGSWVSNTNNVFACSFSNYIKPCKKGNSLNTK